jgi:hypothetical protein
MLSKTIRTSLKSCQASRLFSTADLYTDNKKVHIIGYPFAGGQGLQGPELSPSWLFRQEWLHSLEENSGLSVEMVAVSNPKCNTSSDKDVI